MAQPGSTGSSRTLLPAAASDEDIRTNTGGGWLYRALLCGRKDHRKHPRPGQKSVKANAFEGLEFDDFNSPVNEAHLRAKSSWEWKKTAFVRWFLNFWIGVTVALVATLIIYCCRQLTHARFNAVYNLVDKERDGSLPKGLSFLAFWMIGLSYALTAALPVVFVEPASAGGGIAELKMVLNGVKMPRFLRFKTLLCRIFGNIFSVASGIPAGYEGPMLSIGGGIGAGLSQGKSSTMGFDTRFSVYSAFRNDPEKRNFTVCGAAAGMAAAFNAPIGGVLFSYEEAASFWSKSLTWRAFFCAMVAAYVIDIFMSGLNDGTKWGQLSSPGMFNFGDFHSTGQAQDSWAFWEIPLFVLQGCIGGMAGALFIAVNKRLTTFRLAHVNISKVRRLLDVAFVQTLVSVCAFIVPLTLGNCINKPDPNSTDPNQVNDAAFSEYLISFYCPSTQYNDIASFWFTPTEGAIRLFYHLSSGDNFALVHLVMFFVIYTSLMCLGGGTSIPAGLFIPTLLSGSALGRLVGEVANRVLPNGMAVDAGTYALIGSASMLGGTTRMSISIAVILLEATGNYSYGLPIMVTLMTARLVGNIFNHGLYDMQIELRKWPMLEDRVKKTVANELRVCDVMTKEVRVFQEVEAVGRIADTLQTTEHSGFPVVFSETMLASHPRLGNLAGYIQRKHLAVLLAHRAFHADLPQQRFDRMAHDDDAHKAHAPTETSPYPMIFTAARPSQQAGTLAAAAGGAGGPQHGGPSRLSTLQAGPLDPGASTIAVAAQSAGPASSSATDTTVRGPDSLFVLSAGGEGGGAAAAVAAASQGVGPGSAPSSLPASSSGSTSAPSQRAAALHAVSLSLLDSSLASGISNPASPTGLLTSPPAQAGPGRQGSGHGQGAASSGLPPLAPGSSLSIRTAGAPGSSLPPSVAGTPATASVGSSGRSAGFVDAGADADDSISNRRALLAARTGRAQSQVRLIRVPLTLPAAAAPGGAGGSSGSGSSLPHGMLSRAASLVVGGSGGVGSHMLSHEHAHAGSGGSSLNAAGHHSSSYGGYSALGSGDVGSIASASLAGDGDSSAMFSPAAPAYLTPQDSASHPAYYGGVGSARATGGYTSLMGHPQSAFPGTGGSNRELIAGPSGPGGLRLRSSAQEQLAAGRSSSFAAHGVGFGSLYRTTAGAASGVRQYAAGGTGAYGELPGGFAGDSSAAAGENSGSAEATEAPHSAALYNALYDGEARYADEPLLLWRDFEAAYPRYPDARSLSFTADEKRMYVDLRPYMDPTPLTVHVHTPLQRAYHLFKDMGLRHLLVVNNSHDVVGVVSRNNLTHEWLHECYHAVVEASHERERLRIEAAEAAAGGDGAGRAGGGVWSNLWSSVVGSGGRRQHGKRRGGDGVEPLLAGEEPGSPTSASSSAASTALHRGEIMMSPPRAASVLSPEAVAALHHVRQQSLQGRRGPGMASGDLEAAAAEAAAGSGSAPHAATTPVRPARRAGGQLAGVKYVQFDDHATVDGI